MAEEEINWDFVEAEADAEYVEHQHVIDKNDFVDGYKAGYKRCWNQLNGTWPE